MSAKAYLVTMKGGFLGFRDRLVAEFPDARQFESVRKATHYAKSAAEKLGMTQANWEVMSVSAYDTGAP